MADITNEPRTAEEAYASATGASHLRIEAHRTGAADYIAAAGMNPYRTGLALMRLRSEWDRSSKPKRPEASEIEAAANTLPIQAATIRAMVAMTEKQIAEAVAKMELEGAPKGTDWRAVVEITNPHAGLVRIEHEGKVSFRKPQRVAELEAHRWHEHELGLLLQSLKTLGAVRTELERWIGGDDAPRIVAEVLVWWLDPICKTCGGCGKRIITGTGGRSSGMPCPDCRHSATTGQRKIPWAGVGRRLVNHLTACYHTATAELRQSLKKRRTPENIEARDRAKKDAQIEKLRRADEEDRADNEQEREAVSKHFAGSMSRKKL